MKKGAGLAAVWSLIALSTFCWGTACSGDDDNGAAGSGATGGQAAGAGGSDGSAGTAGSENDAGAGGEAGSGGQAGSAGAEPEECTGDTQYDIASGTSWQWQLTGTIDTGLEVAVYDVDMFAAPQAVIDELQAAGKTVICYFSAGSWEEWRDDAGDFPEEAIGNVLEGWEDEKWLDVRSEAVRGIMEERLDYAQQKGCDGVEPDNMDGYLNDPGFDYTAEDQLDYNKFIAAQAHARGMSVGLKNDLDQIPDLEPCYDWALNEECFDYDECDAYAPFVDAGKAVFHVEYVDDTADGPDLADAVCGDPAVEGFSTLIKLWDLDDWLIACD